MVGIKVSIFELDEEWSPFKQSSFYPGDGSSSDGDDDNEEGIPETIMKADEKFDTELEEGEIDPIGIVGVNSPIGNKEVEAVDGDRISDDGSPSIQMDTSDENGMANICMREGNRGPRGEGHPTTSINVSRLDVSLMMENFQNVEPSTPVCKSRNHDFMSNGLLDNLVKSGCFGPFP